MHYDSRRRVRDTVPRVGSPPRVQLAQPHDHHGELEEAVGEPEAGQAVVDDVERDGGVDEVVEVAFEEGEL
ncbi:hypothetical protein HDU93_004121, partial [Gonapodya sp. JEL0774]